MALFQESASLSGGCLCFFAKDGAGCRFGEGVREKIVSGDREFTGDPPSACLGLLPRRNVPGRVD